VPSRWIAALLTLALAGAAAVPATASAANPPSAAVSALPQADGSHILYWSLTGSSDEVNVLPHLRCAADPSANPLFSPATIPCIWIVDHKAPRNAAPTAACASQPEAYASERCDMRAYSGVLIDAAQQAGDRTVMMFNTKPNGGSGVCAWIPITVRLGDGTGEVRAQDGCVQRIDCAAGYRGTVYADAADVVRECAAVKRSAASASSSDGASEGSSSSGSPSRGSDARPGKNVEAATCTGAKSGERGQSPLYSVYNKPRGKRGMVVYIQMRRAVPITVEIRMRKSGGSKVVRWISRCARKGKNVYTFPNATGGAKQRQAYRVIVRSPNSTYPLLGGWETLPRR
jgi:hypothetical protein